MPESRSGAHRTISRGIVAIYKEHLGRGPDKAHTTITDSFAITICEGSFTTTERFLIDRGKADVVRDIRANFQHVMGREIRELVESSTGRRARSFQSDHDLETDIAVEVVLFEDGGDDAVG